MQKHVNLVDLVKSCPNFHFSVSPHVPFLNLLFEQIAIPTHILLQNLASRQPRTSPFKFARSLRKDPPGRVLSESELLVNREVGNSAESDLFQAAF